MLPPDWLQADDATVTGAVRTLTEPPSLRAILAAQRAPRYRLLARGEDIRQGDEVLQNDAATWAPLSGDLLTVTYEPGQFRPVRRKVAA